MLIQRIYHVDPLVCPKCGGRMRIIAFVEARQDEVIRKVLQRCGLWHDPPPRAPPTLLRRTDRAGGRAGSGAANTVEIDPDFLEHLHRESQADRDEHPWE